MPDRVALPGSDRPRKSDAERISDLNPDVRIVVTVALAGPPLPEPERGQSLSRDQLERDHGADAETIAKVSQVLESLGLKVEESSALTRSLRVSGTSAQMELAFAPELGTYRSPEQGEFRGREGALQIPAELDGLIAGVFGFDQRRVAHRRLSASTPQADPLSPAELSSHYNFPPGSGAGQTVAIAEFGGGYFMEDLTAFCAKYGTAVPKVTPVSVNGAAILTLADIQKLPAPQQQTQLDDSGEVNMDIQILAGLAPSAELIVYFSTFDEQGWVELLNEVIKGQPADAVALSISWGSAEDDPSAWSRAAVKAIDQRLQAAALLGITVCAAAGDDGSSDALSGALAHVDFPGSSPFVLAVGGTMLDGESDVVWWQSPGERTQTGGGATGGGVSTIFPRPSWQTVQVASINPDPIDGRVVPDIAALAGPPYYDLILMGKDAPNGGTSAATPTWAALIAVMAGAPAGAWKPTFLAPLLYGSTGAGKTVGASGCVDVTSGNNISSTLGKGYDAGPGFDAVSGWGVPDGAALLAALTSA